VEAGGIHLDTNILLDMDIEATMAHIMDGEEGAAGAVGREQK